MQSTTKLELHTLNWNTMTGNERNAWLYNHVENKSISQHENIYYTVDGDALPSLTLDRIFAMEQSLSQDRKELYIENILNEMNARKDAIVPENDKKVLASKFYFSILTTPLEVRALCLYHSVRDDYV